MAASLPEWSGQSWTLCLHLVLGTGAEIGTLVQTCSDADTFGGSGWARVFSCISSASKSCIKLSRVWEALVRAIEDVMHEDAKMGWNLIRPIYRSTFQLRRGWKWGCCLGDWCRSVPTPC